MVATRPGPSSIMKNTLRALVLVALFGACVTIDPDSDLGRELLDGKGIPPGYDYRPLVLYCSECAD